VSSIRMEALDCLGVLRRDTFVSMVQTADLRNGGDRAGGRR